MFKVGDCVTCIYPFKPLTVGKSYTIIRCNSYSTFQSILIQDDSNKESQWFTNNMNLKPNFILTSEYLINKNFSDTLNKVLK